MCSSPAEPASSAPTSSTGCWPRATTSTSIDDLSSGRLANLADARAAVGHERFSFHQLDIRDPAVVELIERRAARGDLPPRRPDRRAGVGGRPGVRRRGQHPRHPQRARGRPPGRHPQGRRSPPRGGTIYGEPTRRPARRRGPPAQPRVALRRGEEGRRRLPARLPRAAGLDYTALALANVYGPRQDPHGEAGVVAIFAGRLLAGEPCTDLRRRRADPRLRLRRRRRRRVRAGGRTRAAGSVQHRHRRRDVGQRALPAPWPTAPAWTDDAVHAPARPGELARSCLDAGRAGLHLGWTPFTDLSAGTAAVLDWFRGRDA